MGCKAEVKKRDLQQRNKNSASQKMPLSTKLTKALGIKHPLIQGGMHYVGYAPLVAAVGNAGGIGCITALTQPSPEALQAEIQLCKKLSSKPFGVNLTLLPMLQPPKQLAAAIAMGAEGMNMGTRFMATTEAPIHENIKNALVDGDEHGTALIMRSMRNTERVFKNKDVEEVLRIEKEHPGDFSEISHLVSGQGYRKVFQETGDIDSGVWSAGTVMGLIDSVVSCQELCDSIVAEAESVINGRLANSVTQTPDERS